MVASTAVPHAIGMQVAEDHERDFNYLPPCDIELLRGWVSLPYRP